MSSVDRHVGRWLRAGVIDQAEADRILAFESREREAGGERPGLLEAILYLGVAVAAVGAVALVAQGWDELRSWARIASLAVPGLLAVLAGFAMRWSGRPEVARAGSVAWLAGVALLAGTVGVVGSEADWEVRYTLLAMGALATALSLVLWVLAPAHPQVIALAGGLSLLAQGAATWPEYYSLTTAGLLIMAFGALGLALTEAGLLTPQISARLLSAAALVFGPYYAGLDGSVIWAELLVFAAGAGLVGLSLRRSSFAYMAIGVGGIFVGLVTFIFEHFQDELGAPVALLLAGAFVIAAGLLLAGFRSRLQQGAAL